MLKHILFCDDCFWFAFIYPQNPFEKGFGKKQNIKEIRNKKKKEGKIPSAQTPGLPRGLLPSPLARPSSRRDPVSPQPNRASLPLFSL